MTRASSSTGNLEECERSGKMSGLSAQRFCHCRKHEGDSDVGHARTTPAAGDQRDRAGRDAPGGGGGRARSLGPAGTTTGRGVPGNRSGQPRPWESRSSPGQPGACGDPAGGRGAGLRPLCRREQPAPHRAPAGARRTGTESRHLKRILAKAGVDRPKTRRQPRHRRRRPRAPKAGMLLQIDGSHHAWLEERGPRLVLIAGIDDATGTVPAALFREREDAAGYLALLQQVCLTVGIPLAVYHDGHGIFGVVNLKGSRAYREGRIRYEPTQVERVLAELAIGSIAAQSPQAKGRIERLFGTCQDRLVTELRLAGAATIEEANTVLDTYLPRFNAQFAVPADDPVSAYRPWPEDLAPERIFCFKYQRQVGADNVVRFE